MKIAQMVSAHPLFQGVPPADVRLLVGLADIRHYTPGEKIIAADEVGEIFGILVEGIAQAARDYGQETYKPLGRIESGEVFGEMSLMTGERTTADVIAVTDLTAAILPVEEVARVVAANKESVRYLSKVIYDRLKKSEADIEPSRPRQPGYALGASEPLRILVVNCGSSSLKYDYFDTSSEQALATGVVERLGGEGTRHRYRSMRGEIEKELPGADHARAFRAAVAALTDKQVGVIADVEQISVVGHRVVHGGTKYNAPVLIDVEVKEEIRKLSVLAPLHNPLNLAGIELAQELLPDKPNVAVFDTAFHQQMPPEAYLYGIPWELAEEKGLRRYGFHGTSHEFVARQAAKHLGRRFEDLKIITCHFGNGASITAIEHGRSIDTSMGLTPLEGLLMGTRSGDIDPGVIIHLIRDLGRSPEEVDRLLNRESGLKGISGISNDMRQLMAAAEEGHRRALIAIQAFCYRARKYVGAYVAALGGADVLVFTGGIGEGAPGVRARICQGLVSLGVTLDELANRGAQVRPGEVVEISRTGAPTRVLVIGTDEEQMIARQAVRVLKQARVDRVIKEKRDLEIPISVSAHHVHLTQAHVETLFGKGHRLSPIAVLSQPSQYACQEQVTLVGPKGTIERVRVLGPTRLESQVEVSRTECFKLGIDAPVRMSGDLGGTPGITLTGPNGTVLLERGVIQAHRHIHMSPEDALRFALRDRDMVRVEVKSQRSLVFGDVIVRVSPKFQLDMHIDTDEANAAELQPGAVGTLHSLQHRYQAPERLRQPVA